MQRLAPDKVHLTPMSTPTRHTMQTTLHLTRKGARMGRTLIRLQAWNRRPGVLDGHTLADATEILDALASIGGNLAYALCCDPEDRVEAGIWEGLAAFVRGNRPPSYRAPTPDPSDFMPDGHLVLNFTPERTLELQAWTQILAWTGEGEATAEMLAGAGDLLDALCAVAGPLSLELARRRMLAPRGPREAPVWAGLPDYVQAKRREGWLAEANADARP